jgi:hypothetical protein
MNLSDIKPHLDRLQKASLIVGVLGIILTAVFTFAFMGQEPYLFIRSYLPAYLFWLGICLGSLVMLSLHNTVGGGWGFIIRRPLEAATRLLPLIFIFFLPVAASVAMGSDSLFSWVHPQTDIAKAKAHWWLRPDRFLIGAVVYFLIWGFFIYFQNKWSKDQDEGDTTAYNRLNVIGAAGIVFYVISITLASTDWGMSLTPQWSSTMYGFIFVVGEGLAALTFMVMLVNYLGGGQPPVEEVPQRYYRDLGNLMLTGTLLWAYTAFGQYVITYSGNTREEASWFFIRLKGGWGFIGAALIFLHFFLPFFVLLSSSVKVRLKNLSKIAGFILIMRVVDIFWLTAPTFYQLYNTGNPEVSKLPAHAWMSALVYLACLAGMGGIYMWAWCAQLQKRPLVPLHDPRLQDYAAIQEVAQNA